jgi:hypothetical protein
MSLEVWHHRLARKGPKGLLPGGNSPRIQAQVSGTDATSVIHDVDVGFVFLKRALVCGLHGCARRTAGKALQSTHVVALECLP